MARALALGFLVGFPIAASPGPMFFLILRRTLLRGWGNGVVAGLGVASGDAIYAALAAFGVAAVTNILLSQRRWIALIGGIAIAFIGLQTLRSNPHPRPSAEGSERSSLVVDYGSMVALTLSNPATILAFIAVFAGLGLRVGAGWEHAAALIAGVMLGSVLWWVILTAVVSLVRDRLTSTIARGIGIVAGLALVGFGIVTAAAAVQG